MNTKEVKVRIKFLAMALDFNRSGDGQFKSGGVKGH